MTFKIEVKGRDMQLPETLHDYVVTKMEKLDRYIDGIMEVRVELEYDKNLRAAEERNIAQITVIGKGFTLRAQERTDELSSAFDSAFQNLKRQIERYKGKHYRGRGDGASLGELTLESFDVEVEEEPNPVIARRKKFTLIPMDELEAIEQSKQLGHDDFFVFFNANTNAVNVLYRRRNGSYGLIETEIG